MTTPAIAGIVAACIVCAIGVLVAVICYCRLPKGDDGQLRLREWIRLNKDVVNVSVFESPKYRQSVLQPRASESQPAAPRFSLFSPFAITTSSTNNPNTEKESNMTIDEQYKYQYHAQGVVPETANPRTTTTRKPNSVRIHLPLTRDTEAFTFEM
jgi:hypothetical protein